MANSKQCGYITSLNIHYSFSIKYKASTTCAVFYHDSAFLSKPPQSPAFEDEANVNGADLKSCSGLCLTCLFFRKSFLHFIRLYIVFLPLKVSDSDKIGFLRIKWPQGVFVHGAVYCTLCVCAMPLCLHKCKCAFV